MNFSSNSVPMTLAAGLALLIPAFLGLLLSGWPTILSPLPAMTLLPALVLSDFHCSNVAVAIPMLCFFAWQPGLFRGATAVPMRSYILLAFAILLSALYFIFSWKWGLQYEGSHYTRSVLVVNIALTCVLSFLFFKARRSRPTFKFNLFAHWMLFAWLAWYAFPTLGELP